MMTYEQAVAFVEKCNAAGLCYMCGFGSPYHTHSCLSEAAVKQRGYKFVTELKGNPWSNTFRTVLHTAIASAVGVAP